MEADNAENPELQEQQLTSIHHVRRSESADAIDPNLCTTTWRPNPRILTPDQRAEAEEVYAMFDLDAAGTLKIRPLKMAFRALGIKAQQYIPDPSTMRKAQVSELMEHVAGQEHEGFATLAHFVEMFALVVGLRDIREDLCEAFDLFDEERTGAISFRNIKRIALETGEGLTDADIADIIEGVDRSGDGVINRADFEKAMGKSGGSPVDDLDSD